MTNADEPNFSRGDEHDVRVQVLLTADEFVFARDYAKELGISVSGYLRQLLNHDRRVIAQKQLSANQAPGDTVEITQEMRKVLTALASILKD